MTTYRKFDKYRQRADFMTELFYGVDTQANVLINSGTGTPVYTPGQADGALLGTSAGGTATSFLQRGAVSGTGRMSPVTIRKGRKAHVIADLVVEGEGLTRTDEFGFTIGFFAAGTNPLAGDGLGFTFGYDEDGRILITSKVGAATAEHHMDGSLAEFIHEGHLALEVYYDGTDKVQLYIGRRRAATVSIPMPGGVEFDSVDAGAVLIGTEETPAAMSPTLGIANGGGGANSVRMAVFGYAAQRVPFFGNA